MKSIDLFCGVGGLSLGLEKSGFENILGVEKNEEIAEGFKKNFPKAKCLVGDITKLKHDSYLEIIGEQHIDLIVGGPPCQGFSQKGKRLSLEDERNFLFKYFLDLVKKIKPSAFIIENVPNLLSTSNGFFYKEILSVLESMNYKITAKILNAADYGVPQNRRRAFIVGVNGSEKFSFPEPIANKTTVAQAIDDLPILKSGEGYEQLEYNKCPQNNYQKKMREKSSFVHNHKSTNHSAIALERLALIPENGGKEHLPIKHLTKSIYSGTWTRLKADQQAATITTRFDTPSSGQFTLPTQDRCLTVREAARIQSFPDDFIFTGTKSTQMLQVGNAVPPLLAEAVGKQLYKLLINLSNNGVNLKAA
jgi:DNA (cytosine-5)-methyltransferase 1